MILPELFDRPLASKGHAERIPGTSPPQYTFVIDKLGMSREEIMVAFERKGSRDGFNLKGLIRALLWEEIEACEGGKVRSERKNQRGFLWYECIGPTVVKVMGVAPDDSLESMMQDVWADALDENPHILTLLNVYSEKEALYRIMAQKDSPYPHILIAVEKADWYEPLADIANTWEISFAATGGQKSTIAAMRFLEKIEKRGIDLSDGLTIFSMYDFDPQGWNTPQNLADCIERQGIRVELVRLGLLADTYDEKGIQRIAAPYVSKAENEGAEQSAETLYDRFAKEAGGIYIGGHPMVIKLDDLGLDLIREHIIEGMAKHLDGFPYQIREIKSEIKGMYYKACGEVIEGMVDKEELDYDNELNELWEEERAIEVEKVKRAPEERARALEIQQELAQLNRVIQKKIADLNKRQKEIWNERHCIENKISENRDYWNEYYNKDGVFINADGIIKGIEDWSEWLLERDIEEIDGEYLAKDARKHRKFSWSLDIIDPVDFTRSGVFAGVFEWVKQQIEESYEG